MLNLAITCRRDISVEHAKPCAASHEFNCVYVQVDRDTEHVVLSAHYNVHWMHACSHMYRLQHVIIDY